MPVARNQKPVRKAVFPVAGLGTRFLPATKVLPKEILPLNDRPVIQHSWEEARAAGIEEFIFVSHPRKDILQKHFEAQPDLEKILAEGNKKEWLAAVRESTLPARKLHVTYQPEPLGLGHAVWCAKELVGNEPFAVILPDDVFIADKPCLAQMTDAYKECGGNIVAVMDVAKEETARYGVVNPKSENGRLVDIKGLVEKPKPENAPSTLAVIGRYILQPEIFTHLEKRETGAGGEIQLTDAMAKLIGAQAFHGYRFAGTRYDCGTRAGFLEASIAFALHDAGMRDEAEKILENFFTRRNEAAKKAAV